MTVVVDGDLNIVVGEFRVDTEVVDGTAEVGIDLKKLMFRYIQSGFVSGTMWFHLPRRVRQCSRARSIRQTGRLRDSFDEAAVPRQPRQ